MSEVNQDIVEGFFVAKGWKRSTWFSDKTRKLVCLNKREGDLELSMDVSCSSIGVQVSITQLDGWNIASPINFLFTKYFRLNEYEQVEPAIETIKRKLGTFLQ